MYLVNDDLSIYVTRGDILCFTVDAVDEDTGNPYEFQPGDIVRMKVYGKKDAENVVMQKDFPVAAKTDSVGIFLTESDTKIGDVISKPTDYWYEIELNPFTNPQTIIGYDEDGAKIFKLFPEGRDLVEDEPVDPEDIPVVDADLSLLSSRPVENKAIARAITLLQNDVLAVDKRLTAKVKANEKNGNELTERFNNLIAMDNPSLSQSLEYLEAITEETKAKIDGSIKSDGVFSTITVNWREANQVYGGTTMDMFIIPVDCRPWETGLVHTEDGLEYRINYDTAKSRYYMSIKAQDSVTVAPSGAGTVTMSYALYDYELKDARVGADGIAYATVGEAVRGTAEMFVGLNGVEQVAPKNIYGVKRSCENLFDTATPCARGRYVFEADGRMWWEDSENLDTYIIEVDGESKYSFTNCRTAVVVEADKKTIVRGLSNPTLDITTIDSSGGAYILFSFNPTRFYVGEYMISKGEALEDAEYEMPEWTGVPALNRRVDNALKEQNVIFAPCVEGDLADGEALILNARTNVRKNEIISFYGDIESLGTLEVGLSNSEDSVVRSAYVTVDKTSVTTCFNYSGEVTEAHGLNIGENIVVTLANDGATLTVTVISNGDTYRKTVDYFRFALSNPYCKMYGGAAANCKLSWNAFDIKKRIWMFGDSYFSMTSNSRWMSYLHNDRYADNALISSHAGANSKEAWTSFETLCGYGLPKMVVWCMGMNDGSDSVGATTWYTYRDRLIAFCEENNIVPVFATIPTVPTFNHEEKNAWIRASGYRYIDFAKAVGADSSGVWFDGMLSADGVHPTVKGAKNLYGRFMADFPEITVK